MLTLSLTDAGSMAKYCLTTPAPSARQHTTVGSSCVVEASMNNVLSNNFVFMSVFILF
jgi:hypothetical protein